MHHHKANAGARLGRKVCILLLLAIALPGCPRTATPDQPKPASQKRLASLVPSVTELLYQIGAEVQLVAVTSNDQYPPEVRDLPKVGDQTIDLEKLVSLKPDLVILDSEFNREQTQIQRLGLSVLTLQSRRLEDIPNNLRRLGQELDRREQAEKAAVNFEKSLQALPKLDSAPPVFIEIWGSPLMTVGNDSLPNDLLNVLGIPNVYADQKGYFQVDPEDVVRRRPKVIILPSRLPTDTSSAAKLLERAGVKVTVIVLDGDLFTNPTPRVLEGLSLLKSELEKQPRP